MPAASLSSRIETTATTRPVRRASSAQRLDQRRDAAGVVGAVEQTSAVAPRGPRSGPGTRTCGRRRRHRRGAVSAPRNASAAARREREVASLVAAARADLDARIDAGLRRSSPALARGRARPRPRAPRGRSPAPSTSVPPGRTTSSFSSAMSSDGRPEPARVLEPDVGQHLRRASRARWWRRSGRRGPASITATSTPRAASSSRRRPSAASNCVTPSLGSAPSVDELGGARRARDGGGEAPPARGRARRSGCARGSETRCGDR